MKKYLKSLPHQPKKVLIISLIVALSVGTFGYFKINKKVPIPIIKESSSISINHSPTSNLSLGFLAGGRIKSVSVKANDIVKKGQELAALSSDNTLGALTQARAVYKTAQSNYEKIINGATGTAIDVAKAVVNTAQVNLDGTKRQQDLLVYNAYTNLLNSTISANTEVDNSPTPPSITGTYTKGIEGNIILNIYQTGNGGYISLSGLVSGTTTVSSTVAQAIGDTGLFIKFPSSSQYSGTIWKIKLPNDTAPNYLTNYNAYLSALETKNQTTSNGEAVLDQAKTSLAALVTSARPEDIAMAQAQMDNAAGAVQIAQAAYQNTIITAPVDGKIISVSILPGQIASPNSPAIEFTSNVFSN
ncbi:MAG: biotin/lipoyl-binding protein [bacterium]